MNQQKQPAPSPDGLFSIAVLGVVACLIYKLWLKGFGFYQAHSMRLNIFGTVILVSVSILFLLWVANHWRTRRSDRIEGLVLGESVSSGKPVYFSDEDRMLHMQVIGATRSGKTYYVVSPIICRDIETGNGCLIVDGKSDASFLEFFDASTKRSGRSDVKKLLLADPKNSGSYNPFFWGSPDQITERFFSSFPFENPFYKAVQFNTLLAVLLALRAQEIVPTPQTVYRFIRTEDGMKTLVKQTPDVDDIRERVAASYSDSKKYQEYHAGLISYLSQLCTGNVAKIFNSETPTIRLADLYDNRSVLYTQIPTLQYQTVGPALGRMLLLEMMQVISVAQVERNVNKKILSIVLDDFNDFIFEGFGSLLNKSASAKIGVVFSHQSMGDLEKVSDAFKNVVTTNTNHKIFLRTPDPETAEVLSRTLGTRTTTKHTSRVKESFFGNQKTGDLSERDVEEFLFHPNVLKAELVAGEGIILKTTKEGTEVDRVKFSKPFS